MASASLVLLLLSGILRPGEAVRAVDTRANATTGGSLGCDMVKGARAREAFHLIARCKCTGQESVLSEECGDQAGERKFDITRLPVEVDSHGSSTIIPDCRCMVMAMSERGARPGMSRSRELSGSGSGLLKRSREQAQQDACDRFDAIPRSGLVKGCKCLQEFHLSPECGKRAGLAKFKPEDSEVKNSDCRCLSDADIIIRNPGFVGEVVPQVPEPIEKPLASRPAPDEEDPEDPSAPPMIPPTCKVPIEEGFAFGDMVRIVKMMPDGHFIEIMGIGLFPKKAPAKVSGTIAQVVCSSGTPGSKGRVCLRKGAMGAKSVGCYSPANLEKL